MEKSQCDARMCRKRSVVEKAWGSNRTVTVRDHVGSAVLCGIVKDAQGCVGMCRVT